MHAAALKQVPAAEYNAFEAVQTNILGSRNVIDAAIDRSVRREVALNTDKACTPINLYGATKLVGEKLFGGTRVAPDLQYTSDTNDQWPNVEQLQDIVRNV